MIDLKAERKKLGLTQQQVADETQMSHAGYTNIEIGKRKPSVSAAKRIAKFFGFNWVEFFENIDNFKPTDSSGKNYDVNSTHIKCPNKD